MEINKHPFRVWINEDKEFDINSSSRKKYDYIYNPNYYTDTEYINTFSIIIKYRNSETRIALVGDLHSSVEGCAIITGNQLFVLQNDTLSVIDIETGQLLRFVEIETFGCNFSIHPIETGYIIYGEIEILKLSFDLNVEWRFSARDIFVSIHNKKSFELCENRINLYDFQDNYYEIDFDGNLICDIPAE